MAVPTKERAVARARIVIPAIDALAGLRPGAATDLRLNLFDDASFGMVVEQRTEHASGFSVSGRLLEDETGSFHFVVREKLVVGIVRSPATRQLFHISYAPDGSHRIVQVNESEMGVCGTNAAPHMTSASPAVSELGSGGDAQCNEDPANDITVLIAYTAIARAAAGSTAAIEAECQLAVDTANQTYANSQINTRLRLVHTVEVTYDEVGTLPEHLARLQSPNDGIMDNVHTLRNDYGADMVSLLVQDDDGGTLCGWGYVMQTLSNSFESSAFSVVNRGCASSNFSLAHELGHNMGCDHDRENTTGGGLYSYSYGWRFTGSDMVQYRSVMAYAPGTRVGYFSNPNVTFKGAATGVAIGQPNESSNAQTINNSAFTDANWRRSTFWVDFNYTGSSENGCFVSPFKSVAPAITAAPITGIINFKPGSRNEAITISKPLRLQAIGGVVTIGQ